MCSQVFVHYCEHNVFMPGPCIESGAALPLLLFLSHSRDAKLAQWLEWAKINGGVVKTERKMILLNLSRLEKPNWTRLRPNLCPSCPLPPRTRARPPRFPHGWRPRARPRASFPPRSPSGRSRRPQLSCLLPGCACPRAGWEARPGPVRAGGLQPEGAGNAFRQGGGSPAVEKWPPAFSGCPAPPSSCRGRNVTLFWGKR